MSLACFPKHTSPESECYSDCRLALDAQPVIISTVQLTHWHHDTLFQTSTVTGNDKHVEDTCRTYAIDINKLLIQNNADEKCAREYT